MLPGTRVAKLANFVSLRLSIENRSSYSFPDYDEPHLSVISLKFVVTRHSGGLSDDTVDGILTP